MILYNYLIISILYIILAYVSYLELNLYKLAEANEVKDKFKYKPIKITIYLIFSLIYLFSYLQKFK